MSTTTEKLDYLNATKEAIKSALIAKGQTVEDTDTFRSYADKVMAIKAGGGITSELKFAMGTFTGTGGAQTVAYDPGFMPDILIVTIGAFPVHASVQTAVAFRKALVDVLSEDYPSYVLFVVQNGDNSGVVRIATDGGMDEESPRNSDFGVIRSTTATSFTVGSGSYVVAEGATYYWTAIGGIV